MCLIQDSDLEDVYHIYSQFVGTILDYVEICLVTNRVKIEKKGALGNTIVG